MRLFELINGDLFEAEIVREDDTHYTVRKSPKEFTIRVSKKNVIDLA